MTQTDQSKAQAKGCIGCLGVTILIVALINIMAMCSKENKAPDDQPAEQNSEALFAPGVPGRSSSEICNSTSQECQQWTALAIGCADNMKRREAGYMGKFTRNYCSEMEEFRERVTGVALSTDPGAYNF